MTRCQALDAHSNANKPLPVVNAPAPNCRGRPRFSCAHNSAVRVGNGTYLRDKGNPSLGGQQGGALTLMLLMKVTIMTLVSILVFG
jgi:hypothetical protein